MNDLGESNTQYLKNALGRLAVSIKGDVCDALVALAGIVVAFLAILTLPFALVYFKFLRGHSNCLLWAVLMKIKHRSMVRIRRVKNVRGRTHWQIVVIPTGHVYEWYAKGASQRSRLANLWYVGTMKMVVKV